MKIQDKLAKVIIERYNFGKDNKLKMSDFEASAIAGSIMDELKKLSIGEILDEIFLELVWEYKIK